MTDDVDVDRQRTAALSIGAPVGRATSHGYASGRGGLVRRTVRWGVVLAALLVSCTRRTATDVVKAYAADEVAATRLASSVLFMPGILGSQLVDRQSGEVMWGAFGTGTRQPARDPVALRALALPLVDDGDVTLREDPEVMPGGQLLAVQLRLGNLPLRARAYPGVFEGVIATLEQGGGHFHPLAMTDAVEGRSPVYAVGYDWRRSVSAETSWFHQDVLAASQAREAAGLDPRVDIVAHSMGTQMVRWYLRHGPARLGPEGVTSQDAWDPSTYVRRVLLIAPPNLGEPSVFDKLVHGERPSALLPPYDPVLTMTFPSLYEMLPRPGAGRVVWEDTGEEVDLYDVSLWVRFQWGAFDPRWDAQLTALLPDLPDRASRLEALTAHVAACLDHARRMHAVMDSPWSHPRVPVHVFVGTSQKTPGVLRVDRQTGKLAWGDHLDGDGTVARDSALAQGVRAWTSVHFVAADHMSITAAPGFLEDAMYLLFDAPQDQPATPAP